MKKSLLACLTALTLLYAQAPVGNQTANAAVYDDINATVDFGSDTSKSPIENVDKNFKDVVDHWAEKSIVEAINRGYVDGYPNGNFLPNNNVSRAEFVKMLVSAVGLNVGTASGGWYAPYVSAAQSAGIYAPGDFSDSDWTRVMSREEMAKIAVRSLGITDVEEKEWMYLATKQGIITGTAPGVIAPDGTTTRAQSITVIERILSIKDGKKLSVDKYAVAAAEMYWHKTNIFTVAEDIFNAPGNQNNQNHGINSWKERKLTVAASDGHVKGQVNSITAIDWNDLKDPNRKLLPIKDKLVWVLGGKETKFTDDMDVYVVLLDSTLVVNKKPELYPTNRLSLSIRGYSGQRNGINQPTLIKSKDPKKEVYGLVIPKTKFQTSGMLQIIVETMPFGAPLNSSTLSSSVLSK
ncbi:S-layer homology domain-containing protein [Paenibacillus oralis]|uniref:S-layer homology domain-containing protein n=1 Tax=Paenibacillus oralis TaxID=2490856 RepID=A0A3P3TBI3_9BACL|nr:S-layer homology domain-containing protein [Paenibacillus oralis]RRJ54884.1 S-layer homology domain-containing protein [Paenibacillus oralis]